VSSKVKESAIGTRWENKFKEIEESEITDERLQSTIQEHGAFWFIVNDL